VCRRIFGGMLNFARGAAQHAGEAHLSREVDTTLGILREGIQRRGIEVHVDVPKDLPPVIGVQADLEQLLLNLLTNARDAMPEGGRMSVRATAADGRIELVAPLGVQSSRTEPVRTFIVVVSIEGHDPQLLPDLTAWVECEPGQAAPDGAR